MELWEKGHKMAWILFRGKTNRDQVNWMNAQKMTESNNDVCKATKDIRGRNHQNKPWNKTITRLISPHKRISIALLYIVFNFLFKPMKYCHSCTNYNISYCNLTQMAEDGFRWYLACSLVMTQGWTDELLVRIHMCIQILDLDQFSRHFPDMILWFFF